MLPFFQFSQLQAQAGLQHVITQRVRPDDQASLHLHSRDSNSATDFNLSYKPEAYRASDTAANWRYLAAALEAEPTHFVAPQQVHGGLVVAVGEADWGAGIRQQAWAETGEWHDEPAAKPAVAAADGLVTATPQTWLFAAYADCTPLLYFDPRHRVVGLAHAGWRGTVAGIATTTVQQMVNKFGSRPQELLVGIGPAAGPCHYQVGAEVIEQVQASFPAAWNLLNFSGQPTGHAIFDLWRANQLSLEQVGVPATNIEVAGICTIHQQDQFFSARSDREPVGGRFGAVIGLS